MGCGQVAGKRAAVLRALGERGEPAFEVVAACDLAPSKGAAFAAKWGGQAYPSVGRMLSNAYLDALLICTPPSARGRAENAALAAGVALWIEPPICASIRAGNALALAIRKAALPVMVAAPHRYSPELERARRTLEGKNALRFSRWNGDVCAGLLRVAWRNESKNGTVWLDGAWPLLDLLRFLNIEPSHRSARSFLSEGVGVATLQTPDDAFLSLGASRFGASRESLAGTRDDARLLIENWTNAPRVEVRIERETSIWTGEHPPIERQFQAFARLLREGKRTENRSIFSDALETLKLALALR